MFLSVRNVGKVEHADIEIKGITVIAGENNTGKHDWRSAVLLLQ